MVNAALAAESSVAEMIGSSFSGEPLASSEPAKEVKFEFDAEYQSKIAAFAIRDLNFVRRVGHLLRPEYFESMGEATIVNIALEYYKKYGSLPDKSTLVEIIREKVLSKVIRKDTLPLVIQARKELIHVQLLDGEFAAEKVAIFARHQAVSQAILESVNLLERKQFDKIEAAIKAATEVGINEDGEGYDYFKEIVARTELRLDKVAGKLPPVGITTGVPKLDEKFFHKGWGRKELSVIMGGAKAGKTTALLNFAKAGAYAGFDVLYATCEVSKNILAERIDASLSDTAIKEIEKNILSVKSRIEDIEKRCGAFMIHEYPSGTLKPNDLRRLIERYRSKGVKFDMVVVDYADIMAPNFRYNDPIENSKSIYIDLRAIAFEEDVAMLTATQTNREGFKSAVARAEHVAEDFNKVRTADVMISINSSDEEKAKGEARLYFAASRNQESGFTVFIKQDLAKMRFITEVLRTE
jgi:replicative DNA helicase